MLSDSSDWLTEGETKFRSLDAGVAGVWAVKVEMNVVYRDGQSSPWVPVPGGKMRQVSVGGEAVWATNPADEVFLRVVSKAEPRGKEWTKIDGSMKARAANQLSRSFTILRSGPYQGLLLVERV